MNRIFTLNKFCNNRKACSNIKVDKKTTTKNTDKSSAFTQSMKYSRYANPTSRNYSRIVETGILSLTVTYVTPRSAMITYTYYTKPSYVDLIVTNIQDSLDTQMFRIYTSPYTITGLSPNSYYTINTYTGFASGNRYLKNFESAILTLLEGPPLTPITITDPQYDSATLNFTLPIGNITSVNLTVLETQDTSQILFYPNITSPFLITGLKTNYTYDISLSSFYDSTQNSYLVYKTAFLKTYYENYPVFISATNVENTSATITFSFTSTPSSNILVLTNANNVSDTYFTIINTNSDREITFTGLHIDTSYNLKITSVYNYSGHIYPAFFTNVFHTLNESVVSGVVTKTVLGNLITITYIPSSGNVLDYVIRLRDINNNYVITYVYENYPESVTFYDLTFNTNHTLTIISNYSDNSYTYTYPTYIQTLYEGPVRQMSYNNVENTSANVSFTSSPGAVSNYDIDYQGQRNNINHFYKKGLTTTSFTLTDLAIYTPYTIIITTNYTNGHSYKYTYSELFTTINQGPSVIFNISIHANSMDITFINMYDYPSIFIFNATRSDNVKISESYIGLANTGYTYSLTGLSSSTTYTISIVTQYTTITNNISVTRNYTTTYPESITTLENV